tara:strand:- start:12644 stop:13840 length:1197 start_codon:yes stop_codon:yes gene_type:complete
MINVVIINGGRGASSIIPEILNNPQFKLTSIVNAYDDGKSTGRIRNFFNMLGPSDIRKVQELMIPNTIEQNQIIRDLFNFRYPEGTSYDDAIKSIMMIINESKYSFLDSDISSKNINQFIRSSLAKFIDYLLLYKSISKVTFDFNDCSIMNCIYAGAFLNNNRNIDLVAQQVEKCFSLSGSVIPTNIEDKYLVGLRENGEVLYSEAEIVELRSSVKIKKIYLLDHPLKANLLSDVSIQNRENYLELNKSYVEATENSVAALKMADIIIYSSGTQHSSLYPTYMTSGIPEAITKNTSAKKYFITNIGEDYETPSYKASDFIKGALKYLNYSTSRNYEYEDFFNFVLINKPKKHEEYLIEYDKEGFKKINVKILADNFESDTIKGKHDGKKLLETIMNSF